MFGESESVRRTGALRARSPEHARVLALAIVAFTLFLALGRCVEPDARGFGTHEQLGLPVCRAMSVLGVPCPVCGVTTAVALAARGHWIDSLVAQPLGCALALATCVFALVAALYQLTGRDLGELVRALALRRGALTFALLAFGAAAWAYKIARVCS